METRRRKSNWPAALALFVEEKRRQRFDWRHNNCAFFASDWVAICTGVDPAAEWREGVRTPLGAARLLAREGGLTALVQRVCAAQGWPEIDPWLAGRGDVAEVATAARGLDERPALGVLVGLHVACAGPEGMVFVSRRLVRRAWRIG